MGDYSAFIKSSSDLETTHEVRRAFYIENVMRRSKESTPYLDKAKALYTTLTSSTTVPDDILKLKSLRDAFLDAAGVSRKTREHLDDKDMENILADFVKNVIQPMGDKYVDEITYRYLMALGEQLGGTMRNVIGKMGQAKLTRQIVAQLNVRNIEFDYHLSKGKWISGASFAIADADDIKALRWTSGSYNRTLVYNTTVPGVAGDYKNVDIVMLNAFCGGINKKKDIEPLFADSRNLVVMGELKSGMDRAGGDEHWKTGVHSLNRIRDKYKHSYIFFIGATIEHNMGGEIFTMLKDNRLDFAANLHNENQLSNLCGWLVEK